METRFGVASAGYCALELLLGEVLGIRPVFKIKGVRKCLAGWEPACSAPCRTEPFGGTRDRNFEYWTKSL